MIGQSHIGGAIIGGVSGPLDVRTGIRARHVARAASLVFVAARHVADRGSMLWVRSHHAAPWAAAVQVSGRHVAVCSAYVSAIARHHASARLSSTTPWSIRHVAGWSAPDTSVQILDEPNHLIHQGRIYPIGDATQISIDEGSPVWIASIDLISEGDYSRVAVGDAVTLVIWGQSVALVCDGRRLVRSEDGPPQYILSGISPVALLAEPWAQSVTIESVAMGSETVDRILDQSVTWGLVDWMLPESATALSGAPLDLARQIAGAVSGVIESNPDGSLVARSLYPVSIPDYADAVPVATLTDRDLLGHSDHADVSARINRLIVTSGETGGTASGSIQLDVVADDDDPHAYTIRAYPWPWSDVDLVHTGDAATSIGDRAEVWISQAEQNEILAGSATTRYPVSQVDSTAYQYVNLGRVTVDGRTLTTAVADYSLLNISYQARAWEWRVTNARTETIQFLAMQ